MRFRPNVPSHTLTPPQATADDPSVFAFSLAKAGSTLLYDMLQALTPYAGLTYYSVEDSLFADNVSPNRRPGTIGTPFAPTGYCFGGFRQYPAYPIPILGFSKAVFLVRDPRDMAVSLYFSMTRSHVIPDAEKDEGARGEFLGARRFLNSQTIDEFAVHGAIIQYTRMFEGYIAQGFLWRPNVAIYRYEDIIFDKEAWVEDLCDWYGWQIPRELRQSVVERFDIRPEEERPDDHVRQVTPGNYLKHLEKGTISRMNNLLGEYMRMFGYAE
jgi:hypothetical protein